MLPVRSSSTKEVSGINETRRSDDRSGTKQST
ncbi:unnamed protein product, partial [Rotaria magnacalcarata]